MVSQFATRYCLEQYSDGNFVIMTYDSAEEALQEFTSLMGQKLPLPDIIFLDLGLDEMDGWEFMKRLETLNVGQKRPKIYILSSFSNAKDRALAKEHPMVEDYIDKPLTANRLEKIF